MDFSKYRDSDLIPITEITGNDGISGDSIFALLDSFIYLPDDTLKTLYACYVLTPSALSRIIPVLCIQGLSGTGKSQLGNLASYLRGTPVMTSGDTFAAIRNELNRQKYGEEGDSPEDNAFLIWDDIDPSVFDGKPDIYRLLKVGYDRKTGVMSVAGKEGKNMPFGVFCNKLFSTIHTSFYNDARYSELTRRLVLIQSQKAPKDCNLQDMSAFDFYFLKRDYDLYWYEEAHCESFMKHRNHIARCRPHHIEIDCWKLLVDVMTTGMQFDIFQTYHEASDWLERYFKYHFELIENEGDNLYLALKEYTDEAITALYDEDGNLTKTVLKIKANVIKKEVKNLEDGGFLNRKPDWEKSIIPTMKKLGFELVLHKGFVKKIA